MNIKSGLFIILTTTFISADNLVIEDFENNRANWDPVSDQVMGGLSELKFSELTDKSISFYRLEGEVSTKNNGGFIQFRSRVEAKDSNYSGVRIKTRGNGETYEIHLRTPATFLPWQYYKATFIADEKWEIIDIPFSAFQRVGPAYVPRNVKSSKINWIAIVAYGKDFYAEVDLARIELY